MDVRVRRGHREDIAAVHALLGADAQALGPKQMRRIVDDLTSDFFVAVDAMGGLIGLMAIGYTRLIARGGQVALLDTVVVRGGPPGLVAALVEYAERRAQQRGCRQLIALTAAESPAVRTVLVARGYGSGEGMMRWLQEDCR